VAGILRGEVRWADLNPVRGHEQGGSRPVLIISRDVFNQRSGTVIAMAMTSRPQSAGFPLTFELHGLGAEKRSWVKISQIRTLSVERIGKKFGSLSTEQLAEIVEGLNQIIAGVDAR
jgi:mRNA interferase MazF